jgi:hypothetical protein
MTAPRCRHEAAGIPMEERTLERNKTVWVCPLCEEAANEALGRMMAGLSTERPEDYLKRVFGRDEP